MWFVCMFNYGFRIYSFVCGWCVDLIEVVKRTLKKHRQSLGVANRSVDSITVQY